VRRSLVFLLEAINETSVRMYSYEALKKMKVTELKAVLENAGLSAIGKKDELVARVLDISAPKKAASPAAARSKSPAKVGPKAGTPARGSSPAKGAANGFAAATAVPGQASDGTPRAVPYPSYTKIISPAKKAAQNVVHPLSPQRSSDGVPPSSCPASSCGSTCNGDGCNSACVYKSVSLQKILIFVTFAMVLGFIYHSPYGFGNEWLRLMKIDINAAKHSDHSMYLPLGVFALLSVFDLLFFAWLLCKLGVRCHMQGMKVAFTVWFVLIFMPKYSNSLFTQSPFGLVLIDTFFHLILKLAAGVYTTCKC